MKKTETTNLIRMCPKAVNLSVTSLLRSYYIWKRQYLRLIIMISE